MRHGWRIRNGSKPISLSLPEQLEKLTSVTGDKSPSLVGGFRRELYARLEASPFNRFLPPPAFSSPVS